MTTTVATTSLHSVRLRTRLPKFLNKTSGVVGTTVAVAVISIAVLGPFLAPNDPDISVAAPYAAPSADMVFGADAVGRDVLSRVLCGGYSVLTLALTATLLAYVIGGAIGLIAGFKNGSWIDELLMRAVDVLLAFPPLIFLLVVATGAGRNLIALVLAIGVIMAPGLARIVRSAVLDVMGRGYVEAATARGERPAAIVRREIIPNIVSIIAADVGLRLSYSILLLASVSFLGLGVQPPQSDWARMVSENISGFSFQPWAVLVPALTLGTLIIAINLTADSVAQMAGISLETSETGAKVTS